MSDDLKKRVMEFADIAKDCPESFQEKCFQLLLEDYLSTRRGGHPLITSNENREPGSSDIGEQGAGDSTETGNEVSEEIAKADVHLKVWKFMKSNSITIEQINELFYKEDGEIKPLYEDLRTTQMAESQVRIALLQAFINAMPTGEFTFNGEEVRAEAQLRKCYDLNNFAANFKNNKSLFDGFEKYDKSQPIVKVSSDGKAKLASLINELQ